MGKSVRPSFKITQEKTLLQILRVVQENIETDYASILAEFPDSNLIGRARVRIREKVKKAYTHALTFNYIQEGKIKLSTRSIRIEGQFTRREEKMASVTLTEKGEQKLQELQISVKLISE